MKTTIMLDTLAFANQLKAAGVPSDVAEAHATANAKMLEGLIDTQLATKQDINHLEKDMHSKLKDLEIRLTIRIGIMIASVLGVYTALMSMFLHLYH